MIHLCARTYPDSRQLRATWSAERVTRRCHHAKVLHARTASRNSTSINIARRGGSSFPVREGWHTRMYLPGRLRRVRHSAQRDALCCGKCGDPGQCGLCSRLTAWDSTGLETVSGCVCVTTVSSYNNRLLIDKAGTHLWRERTRCGVCSKRRNGIEFLVIFDLFLQMNPQLLSQLRVVHLFATSSKASIWNKELYRIVSQCYLQHKTQEIRTSPLS